MKIDKDNSECSPGMSLQLVGILLFLLTIGSTAISQTVIDISHSKRLGLLRIFVEPMPSASDSYAVEVEAVSDLNVDAGLNVATFVNFNRRLKKHFHTYELDRKRDAWLHRWLRPRLRLFAAKIMGDGGERVMIGRDGWLYYQRATALLTDRLNPNNTWRKTISAFRSELAKQKIELVLVPIPVKAAIHPEPLLGDTEVLSGATYASFVTFCRNQNIAFIDLAPLLRERALNGQQMFLKTDTHWTPAGVDVAAVAISDWLLNQYRSSDWQVYEHLISQKQEQTNLGDIARYMLALSERQSSFPAETAALKQVWDRNGNIWRPDASAQVILLGDSFTNVFSWGPMRWGEGAGLAERISYVSGLKLDRIAINDGGASAVPQTLLDRLRRDVADDGTQTLRLVIWTFTARELVNTSWRIH